MSETQFYALHTDTVGRYTHTDPPRTTPLGPAIPTGSQLLAAILAGWTTSHLYRGPWTRRDGKRLYGTT